MNENIIGDLIDILTPNFSTTSLNLKQTAQITMMSSTKHFFKYDLYICGCGISYINLEGTSEDWEKIKEKAEKLREYVLNGERKIKSYI